MRPICPGAIFLPIQGMGSYIRRAKKKCYISLSNQRTKAVARTLPTRATVTTHLVGENLVISCLQPVVRTRQSTVLKGTAEEVRGGKR